MGVLDGMAAIVTGAGKGIGRGEAIALAKEGAAVTVLSRHLEDLIRVRDEIAGYGGRALALECDVRSRQQVDHAVERTLAEFGSVDILVNNAQAIAVPHPLETWTEEEERLMWESGYLGTWHFMQACFPHMKARNFGRIVNTCSLAGFASIPGYAGYAATKEAIRTLTRIAAREWGQYNITVNVISPAVLGDHTRRNFPDEESQRKLIEQTGFVIRRWGDAEKDIGRAIVYLAGPDGGYMTGCTLNLDAGSHMIV